ncbi:serine hydrolase domain-containing protein [Erythrobacter sp. GH1-10]|uniref:serine hydrolase domain-containing protein n=1 Tax=Erythrobacter sp. GH1-10 TaxID=3349334 RepID=UPI0038782BB8
MAFRTFEPTDLSRRALLRGGGYMAAGAALASLPFGRGLLAHDVSHAWPNVAALAEKYVGEGKVANLYATFGWGRDDMAHTVGGGTLSIDGSTEVDMDSLYRIYSMTKPVTGIATMMLIDEGKLGLDQPLYDILPAYREMMVQKEYDGAITEDNLEPAKGPITIRQLLTHTSGLGYGIVQKGPIKDAYEEQGLVPGQVTRLPIPGIGRAEAVRSLETFADRLAELPLVLQPGTKWSYSVSLDLLGRVIEVVEGKPFDVVLQEKIFDPCGMTSTYFTVPDSEIGRFTDNYGILAGTPMPIDPAESSIYLDEPAFPFGGAGLVSSPRDYDRFLRMLLGYGKIGNERVMGELAVRVATSNILPRTATTEGTWVAGQGFGAGGRSTNGQYGWGGAAGTLGAVDFNLGLRAALWTQYMPTEAFPIRDEYMAALEKDLMAMRAAKAA